MALRRGTQFEKYLTGTNNTHHGFFLWELKDRKDRIENYSEISTLDDWLKDELLIETGNKGGESDFWS